MEETVFDAKLAMIRKLLATGPDAMAAIRIYELLGGTPMPEAYLEEGRLYSENLPKAREIGVTREQRYLHFLWDAFDKLPLSLLVPFSVPFRRMLGRRLFRSCGQGLIVEENVRFNYGQSLDVGEHVFFNRGVYLDTGGGLTIGNFVSMSEDVRIFTHGHSEAEHTQRTYQPVVIKDYVKIYSGATVLPGVTIGKEAIVASGSMVIDDVPAHSVVAGRPAKYLRERRTEGKHGEGLAHNWHH